VRGFTIIELIVATAILTSFLALGIPTMHNMVERHTSRIVFDDLRRTLAQARGLAQDKLINVSVCPLQGKNCTPNWDKPVTVFNDQNNNNTVDANEEVFFSSDIQTNYGYWKKSKASQNYVRFNPLGHAFSSATTFLYCPFSNHDAMAKSIVISFQGRIRTASYLNEQGQPYAHFSNLNCD
jgi:type IV fimbrial biogenesis protein FimT